MTNHITMTALSRLSRLSGFVCLLVCLITSISVSAEEKENQADKHHHHDARGHSDALLLLIADKLAIEKLQQKHGDLTSASARMKNLAQQQKRLSRALPRLQQYTATPQGHYANLELYQQSLENRASMLVDFARLLQDFHNQHDLDQTPPN